MCLNVLIKTSVKASRTLSYRLVEHLRFPAQGLPLKGRLFLLPVSLYFNIHFFSKVVTSQGLRKQTQPTRPGLWRNVCQQPENLNFKCVWVSVPDLSTKWLSLEECLDTMSNTNRKEKVVVHFSKTYFWGIIWKTLCLKKLLDYIFSCFALELLCPLGVSIMVKYWGPAIGQSSMGPPGSPPTPHSCSFLNYPMPRD